MDPLSITASIIAIAQLTVKVGQYISSARDIGTECSQFASETSNASSLLFTLLSRFDETSEEPWHVNVRALGGKGGPISQYRDALEQLKIKITKKGNKHNLAKTLLWKHVREDIERILLRIERLKSLVNIALQMDHLKLSEATKSLVQLILPENQDLKTGIDAIQQDQDLEKHHRIIKWLSRDKFQAQQIDLIGRRQEDTGSWFIESPTFTDWVDGTDQTLFCPGMPGAGKTMMAAITVDHLQKHVRAHDTGSAYIYCDYKQQADQNTVDMLAAILKQLVQDRPSLAKPLWTSYERHQSAGTKLSLEETLSALKSAISNFSQVYIVVDALDEYPSEFRQELLTKLHQLQSKSDLRLMATSRFIPDIVEYIEHFYDASKLEVRADDTDVKRYVTGQMNQMRRCVQRDAELQALIQERIAKAANGMFLLARLHVDSLRDKDTKRQVRSALDELSKGSEALSKAYDGAIERIDGQLAQFSARAKEVLSWITYAQRPLTTSELCHALAVKPGDKEIDDEDLPDTEEIVSFCAGLVTIDEERNIIRLVHYTTQEYLEGILESWNPGAQQDIASTCLTYLCFDCFKDGGARDQIDFQNRLERNVFLQYSADYWGEHVAHVQEDVAALAMQFLLSNSLVASAVQANSIYGWIDRMYGSSTLTQTTGLHLAARAGLLHLLKEVIFWIVKNNSSSIDTKDNRGRTPLLIATECGHEAIVRLLVDRDDVEADSRDKYGMTPLSTASLHGYEATVKLLVERDDVKADSQDKLGRSSLAIAAIHGHEAIVKLLLERDDVDPDLQDRSGETPLAKAIRQGHIEIVKLLLNCDGVNPDSVNRYGHTPLRTAALSGYEAIVSILVERGVEPNRKDYFSQTPLSRAASSGYGGIVKLLMEQYDVKVDLLASDNCQTEYLIEATHKHEAIEKLLDEKGITQAFLQRCLREKEHDRKTSQA